MRASTEPYRYKNSAHTSTYRNHNAKYIAMAAESGSTDFSDFFYEVRASRLSPLLLFSEFSIRTDRPLSLPRTSPSRTSLYQHHPLLYSTSHPNTIFWRIRPTCARARGLQRAPSPLLITALPRRSFHLRPSFLLMMKQDPVSFIPCRHHRCRPCPHLRRHHLTLPTGTKYLKQFTTTGRSSGISARRNPFPSV